MTYRPGSAFIGLVGIILVLGAGTGLAMAQPYDHYVTWGSSGAGDGQLDLPRGIGIDENGNVYIADSGNNRTQVFSSEGSFLRQWGSCGTGDGQFNLPSGIAVDGDLVFISDTRNDRVQVFGLDGNYRGQVATGPLLENVSFRPVSVAVNSSGFIFAGGNGGVHVFNPDREHYGSLSGPFQGSCFGLAFNTTGYLYASDTAGHRVFIVSPGGRLVATMGKKGTAPGEFLFPFGMAIDASDRVFVADAANYRVQVLDPSGIPLYSWGSRGNGTGEYEGVLGVAITDKSGESPTSPEIVYTTDFENDRVQAFIREVIPEISGVDPQSGRAGTKKQLLRISGTGFLDGCTVRLVREGSLSIPCVILGEPYKNRLITTINLTGAGTGLWDIVVENPGGAQGRVASGFLVR